MYLPDKKEKQTKEVTEDKPKEKTEEKSEEKKERIVVVKEIPTQEVREHIAEDGTILHFITIEEALTEFVNQK